MKKIITFSILAVFTLLVACRKSDNPKIPELTRVPVPSLTKEASGASSIIVSDLSNFVGKINVDVYFKSDVPPKKMDLVIIKNGDITQIKTLKADITNFPTLVPFTGPELVALFGDVETCDYFDVGVNITTKEGTVFEAFPAVGSAYGAGVAGQFTGVNTSLTYSTKVEYDPSFYSGNFVVVSDGFGDYLPGDVVELTQINATQFSFIHPAVRNPLPIIATVNPETLFISVPKQKIGDWFLWEPGYTNPSVATIPASNARNRVIPCEGRLSISFNYTVDQGSFGEYVLVFQKQ